MAGGSLPPSFNCEGNFVFNTIHRQALAATCALAAMASALLAGTANPAAAAIPDQGPFTLGVQTHYSQGWSTNTVTMAKAVKAATLRDSAPWTAIETSPGVYNLTHATLSRLDQACAAGNRLILTEVPKNPLYDSGKMVYSAGAKTAYAKFVSALLGRLGPCVVAVEVGNEINGPGTLNYPSGTDWVDAYVSLLSTLRTTIKARYPGVAILGGSTNLIGTGFLDQLFAGGMLPLVDGVVVHPYRSRAHSVDLELRALFAAMEARGRVVPVWATEWSHDITDANLAASEEIKMIVLMAASGVKHASWYALLDQPSFPNMGLYASTTLKPQGRAYGFAQSMIVPFGRPTRVDFGDPLFNAWRYPDGRMVVWGSPRTITLGGSPQIYNAQGTLLPAATTIAIDHNPVLIVNGSVLSAGRSTVIADIHSGYGTPQWTYWSQNAKGAYGTLTYTNDWFTGYYAGIWVKPLRIGMGQARPAGTGTNPIRAVLRHTATAPASAELYACMTKVVQGDGVDYQVRRNGTVIAKGVLTGKTVLTAVPVDLATGDRFELAFGPNQTSTGDLFNFRATLFQRGTGRAVDCP